MIIQRQDASSVGTLVILFALVIWTMFSLGTLCGEAWTLMNLGNTSCESAIHWNATDFPWYGMPISRWLYVDVVIRCCLVTVLITVVFALFTHYDRVDDHLRNRCCWWFPLGSWRAGIIYVATICYVVSIISWGAVAQTSRKLFKPPCCVGSSLSIMCEAIDVFMVIRLFFIP